MVQLPLFTGYVFVKIGPAPSARVPVLRANGVIGFVGVRGVGVPIQNSEIDSVRLLLARGIAFQQYPFLNVGQRVRVRGGSLDAVEGILVASSDQYRCEFLAIRLRQPSQTPRHYLLPFESPRVAGLSAVRANLLALPSFPY
jgi:hypothetical protein